MDNLTNNIYLIERIDQKPQNINELYNMGYSKIVNLLNNPNEKTKIAKNNQFIDSMMLFTNFYWLKIFHDMQNIIPKNAINYVHMVTEENRINYSIIVRNRYYTIRI